MTSCSFNEPILKIGDKGNDVELLQTSLQQYFVDKPGLTPPLLSPGLIDGDFGPKTEASLKSFQAQTFFGTLALVDGIAGPITWSRLDAFDTTFPTSDLNQGATGNSVRRLQRVLFAAASDPGSVDGIYGPMTAAAVRDFEQKEGLPQTGNAAGKTREILGAVVG